MADRHLHDHAHHAQGARAAAAPGRMRAVLVLTACYMLAELFGGLAANSLALLADAGHMLADVAALGLSLFASWVARRPPTASRTYGSYRAEILAALANGAVLAAMAVSIVVEALQRLSDPEPVRSGTLLAIASGGLLVNLTGMALLHPVRHGDLNLRGAWLHVAFDALGSLGALAAGALAWGLGWQRADPLAGVLISILVVWAAWTLLRQAVAVLMEGTPAGIDADRVRADVLGVAGVLSVHDLHIWTITSGMHSLSAHVEIRDVGEGRRILRELQALLAERFGLDHVTLQLECAGADESLVCPVGRAHP
jgi:cobalt-zinc-cadmium efflux system protein